LRELVQGWKDDPETLPLLKERVQLDEDGYVREGAVQELARSWKDDLEILPWLKKQGRWDKRLNVRIAVVRELARGRKDDPETLSWLKDCARSDEDSDVRQAVVWELVHGWKDDSDTFSFFLEVATQDPFRRAYKFERNPRKIAIKGLLKTAPENSLVIDLLRDRAANDSDDLLREWATEQLAKIDPQ